MVEWRPSLPFCFIFSPAQPSATSCNRLCGTVSAVCLTAALSSLFDDLFTNILLVLRFVIGGFINIVLRLREFLDVVRRCKLLHFRIFARLRLIANDVFASMSLATFTFSCNCGLLTIRMESTRIRECSGVRDDERRPKISPFLGLKMMPERDSNKRAPLLVQPYPAERYQWPRATCTTLCACCNSSLSRHIDVSGRVSAHCSRRSKMDFEGTT